MKGHTIVSVTLVMAALAAAPALAAGPPAEPATLRPDLSIRTEPPDAGAEPGSRELTAGAAGATLGWARNIWGTSKDDEPAAAAIRGGSLYVAGTMYDDILNIDQAKQMARVKRLDLATGAELASETGQCHDPFGWDHASAAAVATDGSGTVYVSGHFRCRQLCFSRSGHQTCQTNDHYSWWGLPPAAGFLAAFDASLTPVWSESLQGRREVKVESVAPSGGSVFVAGHFADSPLEARGHQLALNRGRFDVFVVRYAGGAPDCGRYDGSRSCAVWIGGTDDDGQAAVTTDSAGYVYVTGYFRSPTLYVTRCTAWRRNNTQCSRTQVLASLSKVSGGADVFVVKLTPDLKRVVWARALGGPDDDKGVALATRRTSAHRDVYVTGFFTGSLTLPGCCTLQGRGGKDAFAVLLDADTGRPAGGIVLGSPGTDEGTGIAVVPSSGRIYLTGFFAGTMNVGGFTLTTAGGRDAYLVEVDRYGTVHWAGTAGGVGTEEGRAVATAPGTDAVVVTGVFDSDPMWVGSTPVYRSGRNLDGFAVRLTHQP